MMESLIPAALSLILAAAGYTVQTIKQLDKRVDGIELDLARNYVTREELDRKFDVLFVDLRRIEEKIDAHVSEDTAKINEIKAKYYSNF